MSTNLYKHIDPTLQSADYRTFGTGVAINGSAFEFNGAGPTSAIGSGTGLDLTDLINDYFAKGGAYEISVFVSGHSNSSVQAKLLNGASANLNVAGNGWTSPVPITAGVATGSGLAFLGVSATVLNILPDTNDPDGSFVRITTA
jgi:hypothetical protein